MGRGVQVPRSDDQGDGGAILCDLSHDAFDVPTTRSPLDRQTHVKLRLQAVIKC